MSTEAEEKQMVEDLKQTMLAKLAKNRYKRVRVGTHICSLHTMMSGASCKLFTAIMGGDSKIIMEKAADVANFAGRIHDLAKRGLKEEVR